jgi:hypothetical protein
MWLNTTCVTVWLTQCVCFGRGCIAPVMIPTVLDGGGALLVRRSWAGSDGFSCCSISISVHVRELCEMSCYELFVMQVEGSQMT